MSPVYHDCHFNLIVWLYDEMEKLIINKKSSMIDTVEYHWLKYCSWINYCKHNSM